MASMLVTQKQWEAVFKEVASLQVKLELKEPAVLARVPLGIF